jgi:hypothetical protein
MTTLPLPAKQAACDLTIGDRCITVTAQSILTDAAVMQGGQDKWLVTLVISKSCESFAYSTGTRHRLTGIFHQNLLPFHCTAREWEQSRPVKPDACDVLICLGSDIATALDLPHSDGDALDYLADNFGTEKPSEALAILHALRAGADKMGRLLIGTGVSLAEFSEACRELDQ